MDNIYLKTENERNSIVELPEGFAKDAGSTLYSWLGSLWRGLHKGEGMIKGLQEGRGIRLAQLYLDILEAANLKDRNGAPVFHRELWHPIIIRSSLRDKAQENMLKIGMDGEIGPQPAGSEYGEGYVFQMGVLANYKDYVTYPIGTEIAGGARTIVDNIVNPTVLMESGDDFVIRNGTIIFHRDNDPLADGSAFEKYDINGFDPDDPSKSDIEAVLWASDVLLDRNYIANHISYAIGADAPSSDVVKRIVNAAWSSITSGLTPELIRTLFAAMLNIPVVQNEKETVIDIEYGDNGTVVRTDLGSYAISKKAKLRKAVFSGAVMKRGDLIDESLRIYPFLNSGSTKIIDGLFSVPVEQDIPSVIIEPEMIRASTEYGVYATWDDSVIKRKTGEGSSDYPHLYFDLGGTENDVSAFWNDIWKTAENRGVSMESIIGKEGDVISPAAFMIWNLIGANTIFVVVDKSQIDDISMMRNPMFFDMISDVVPSGIRLFVVEHNAVGEDDWMDLKDASEGEFLAAALPKAEDGVYASETPPMGGRGPSFCESVSFRFVRPAPIKVRVRKEEEKW